MTDIKQSNAENLAAFNGCIQPPVLNPPALIKIKLTKKQVKKLIKSKEITIGQFVFTIND
jgi:hypothetical protein